MIKKKLDDLLVSLGLERIKYPNLPPIFAHGGGACRPFFCPDLQSRFGGVQIKGAIGIFVDEFEGYWRTVLRNSRFGANLTDTFLLSLYITNIDGFRNPPVFDKNQLSSSKNDEVLSVISAIIQTLESLPHDLVSLNNAFGHGDMLGWPIHAWVGHPVKMKIFEKWALKNGLENFYKWSSNNEIKDKFPYDNLIL